MEEPTRWSPLFFKGSRHRIVGPCQQILKPDPPATIPGGGKAVTVADNVPKFNIERGCKVDSTASSLDTGLDETIKDACRMSNKGKTSFKRNGRNLPRPTRRCVPV
jgi:hypothetical protein